MLFATRAIRARSCLLCRFLSVETPRSLRRTGPQPAGCQPVSSQGAFPSQVRGFAFVLESSKVSVGLALQSLEVPLSGSPAPEHRDCPPWFGVTCEHDNSVLSLLLSRLSQRCYTGQTWVDLFHVKELLELQYLSLVPDVSNTKINYFRSSTEQLHPPAPGSTGSSSLPMSFLTL